jgi:hypothetical protein
MSNATVVWDASPYVQDLADEVEDRMVGAHRQWIRNSTGVTRLMLRAAATAADTALARAAGNLR